jgi:hypothetical protein
LCDNKNLASDVDSADLMVRRWKREIKCSGCITHYWIPGSWNTIADYGSRAVQANPAGQLSVEEEYEDYLNAIVADVQTPSGASAPAASPSTSSVADATPCGASGPAALPAPSSSSWALPRTTVVPGHTP